VSRILGHNWWPMVPGVLDLGRTSRGLLHVIEKLVESFDKASGPR
jgi:hypothetical protein